MNATEASAIDEVCISGETDFEGNLTTYGDVLASTRRKASSINTNIRYLRVLAKTVDDLDPAKWTEVDIQKLLLSERFRQWKASTQSLARAVLKSYWEVLNRTDMLPPNNYAFWRERRGYGGGSNRYDELKAKAPSQKEVDKVLEICRDVVLTSKSDLEVYRHFALYLAAAYGLRRMEVANLRLCDLRLEDDTLHIEESKGDKSRDIYMDVPIGDDIWQHFMAARSSIIERLLSRESDVHIIAKLEGLTDRAAPLFFFHQNGATGEQMSAVSMGKMLGRLASKILGRSVNPHAFRHAKAFYLLEVAGVKEHTAAQYLGHANIQQTYKYVYADVESQRTAFKNGTAPDSPKAEGVQPTALQRPSEPQGRLDAAVQALTAAYSRGDLSAEAFAAAVAALSNGAA